jgi:hypothetical protein
MIKELKYLYALLRWNITMFALFITLLTYSNSFTECAYYFDKAIRERCTEDWTDEHRICAGLPPVHWERF